MPRPPRVDRKNLNHHVMNRGNGRMTIFEDDADLEAFEKVLEEALARSAGAIELQAYCVMPNHWHLLVRTTRDGALATFMGWLTLTHTRRWHAHRKLDGHGHLYQGRFRNFVVESGTHLAKVARYVERNPLRAGLVERAEDWRFSSLWRWHAGTDEQRALLSAWPPPVERRPAGWLTKVNRGQTPKELEAIREAVARGRPFGSEDWRDLMIRQHGLESTLRPRGRPRKVE